MLLIRNGWHTLSKAKTYRPLATNQLATSVSFKTGWFAGTLEWLTVDCCYHFLLVEGVWRHLSLVAKTQYCDVLVSRGGWCKVSVSFLLPPLQPRPVSSTTACMRLMMGTSLIILVRPHIRHIECNGLLSTARNQLVTYCAIYTRTVWGVHGEMLPYMDR